MSITLLDARPRHPEKAHRPDNPVARKPAWIRAKAPGSPGYAATQALVREHKLATVCEEARCPNIGECWEKKHATFMIMGEHLHARLRLLQRRDRPAAGARRRRARARRRRCRQARPVAMSSSPRSTATISPTAAPRISPPSSRAIRARRAGDHDRGADAGFPAQGRARWRSSSRRGPTCSTTISKPSPANISPCARARATSTRCGSCSG